jgi:hypothetical protein
MIAIAVDPPSSLTAELSGRECSPWLNAEKTVIAESGMLRDLIQ